MQVVTAIALLLKFGVAGVVGARLLKLPGTGLSPERCLAWFFIVADLIGGVLITVAYGIWAAQGRAESSGTINALHGLGQVALSFGYAMILLFTQRTFYPESAAARATVWSVIGVLVGSLLGRAFVEGFAISLAPGAFHWIGYGCRIAALVGVSVVALGYWMQMRRRAKLGLADPLVANRFLLWGLWAAGNLLAATSEPIARFLYGWLTGADAAAAQSIQQVGGAMITITLCLTSVLALFTTLLLFLAFFPTDGYRRWIAHRAGA